jgi:hypothetical protein
MPTKTRTSMLLAALPIIATLALPVASAAADAPPEPPAPPPAVKRLDRHAANRIAPRAFGRSHRRVRTPRSHRRVRALASTGPSYRSPGGHIYTPSTLVCTGSQIGGKDFYADTEYGNYWVGVTNTLLHYYGANWYVRQAYPRVGASGMGLVSDYTQWLYTSNGANVYPGQGASPVFTFDARGYHAISQKIEWFGRGAVAVDSVTVTLRDGLNGYYCYH